jgi:hypothetical protein
VTTRQEALSGVLTKLKLRVESDVGKSNGAHWIEQAAPLPYGVAIACGGGQTWHLETVRRIGKPRHWRAFLALLGVKSLCAGMVGWRRSADRTSLRSISLLTGNFTGKLAISGFK